MAHEHSSSDSWVQLWSGVVVGNKRDINRPEREQLSKQAEAEQENLALHVCTFSQVRTLNGECLE